MSSFKPSKSRKSSGRKQVGNYILERAIGFGAFSTVYEGTNTASKSRERVAIKSINLHRINVSSKHLANLKQEIDILRKCKHRNIVQLLQTYQTQNHIYLIMQFCGGGDLHRFIASNGKMTERNAQSFSLQFVEGLKYLHSLKIIHRDLKPQNILLSESTPSAIIRIADFGFARYKPSGHNLVDTMCGSPLFMAPEILKFNKYDSKVDLWSAGTIIYQMLAAKPPFNGLNHIELLKNIESTKTLKFPSGLSAECKDLLLRLLKRNPSKRISWNEFFAHPWLQHKDEFIVIDDDISIKEAEDALSAVSTEYEYAKSIMKVGDIQVSREQISCALLLYLRGLDILEEIIGKIQNFICLCAQSRKKSGDEQLVAFSIKFKELLLQSIGSFDDHWKRGEAIQTLCASQCLSFDSHSINVDEVIFHFAVNIAKKLCSDVMLNQSIESSAIHKMKESQLLLQYLLTLQSISDLDKRQIKKCMFAHCIHLQYLSHFIKINVFRFGSSW